MFCKFTPDVRLITVGLALQPAQAACGYTFVAQLQLQPFRAHDLWRKLEVDQK